MASATWTEAVPVEEAGLQARGQVMRRWELAAEDWNHIWAAAKLAGDILKELPWCLKL